jgi:predicted nucleic acid-binding protein
LNYLDTSALIKRFVDEKGSSVAHSLVQQGGPIATATIAYAEVFSGLARKLREKHLSRALFGQACRQFEGDWQAYIRVELHTEILVLARDLIQRYPLRGFDAVHLASAVSLQNALGEGITFVAADGRLLKAAESEKLDVLNIETAGTQ